MVVAGPNMLRLELLKSSGLLGKRSGADCCGPKMLFLVRSNCSLITGEVDVSGGCEQQTGGSKCGPRIVIFGSLKSAGVAGLSVGSSSP